jgi:multicomponent Na+:H+ antiporter subunit D
MHIAMHAFGKITLFFCAGAIMVAAHKTKVSELNGLGRRMPFTFFAFFLGALCVIGAPPLGGIWSKWHLFMGAYDGGQIIAVAVLVLSTVLNIAYLLPPVVRAFLLPPKAEPDHDGGSVAGHGGGHGEGHNEGHREGHHEGHDDALGDHGSDHRGDDGGRGIREAPAFCVVPLTLTALGCLILFFFAEPLFGLLEGIAELGTLGQ